MSSESQGANPTKVEKADEVAICKGKSNLIIAADGQDIAAKTNDSVTVSNRNRDYALMFDI